MSEDNYLYYIDSNISEDYNNLKLHILTFCSQNLNAEHNILISLYDRIIKDYYNLNIEELINNLKINSESLQENNFDINKSEIVSNLNKLKEKFQIMQTKFHQLIFNNENNGVINMNDLTNIKSKINDYNFDKPINFNSILTVLSFLRDETNKLTIRAENEKDWYLGKKVTNFMDGISYYLIGSMAYPFNRCSYKYKYKCYIKFLDYGIIPLQTYITTKTNELETCDRIFKKINGAIGKTLDIVNEYNKSNYNCNTVQSFIENFKAKMLTISETLKIKI